MNAKTKLLFVFLAIVGVALLMMSPVLCAEIDLTTNLPANDSTLIKLDPITPAGAVGNVLWDTSHGIYYNYRPSGDYSSLSSALAALGYAIDENSSGVLSLDLSAYSIVVVCLGSAWDSAYSPAEVSALVDYVNSGGGLFIMGDNDDCPNANINPVAEAFGTTAGLSDVFPQNLYVTNLTSHPIFAGISSIFMRSAGELVRNSAPSSEEAWADTGEVVVTVAESGLGRVVVLGNIDSFGNYYLPFEDNQVFAENIFHWLYPLPVCYIKANDSDGPLTVSTGSNLRVTVELDASGHTDNADWFVLADAGTAGWYFWHLSGAWYPGIAVSYMGPLADVSPPYEVLNYTGLLPGIYTFYFGVDTNINGVIDVGNLYYDSVIVEVELSCEDQCQQEYSQCLASGGDPQVCGVAYTFCLSNCTPPE
jgi:hypothetical protein